MLILKSLSCCILLLVTAGGGCKEDASPEVPSCIEAKIKATADRPVANPPKQVFSYHYRGKTVYYFTPECCDIPSVLYDQDCNLICSPDGGLSGKGDGSCTDFFSDRKDEKLIWADPREQ